MKKRFFIEILKEICREENLQLEIYNYEWLCKITDPKTGKFTWTEGYNFELNSAVNYIIFYDKVNTSTILENNNIPVVTHRLILKEEWKKLLQVTDHWEKDLDKIIEELGTDLVVKLCNGSQGLGVYKLHSREEAIRIVNELKDKQNLAISKYYESEFEYRFYVLDGQTLFAYKKIKNIDTWKHNLSQGGKAVLLSESDSKYQELQEIVRKVCFVTKMRCGAIDILDTKEGLKVLEINNGIMMDSFASQSQEYYEIAKSAHKQMLLAALSL